jgi:hypothetical protein
MHYLYGDSDYVLVYFSFYFDPEIKGVDPYGEPYTDANVFMNQMIEIKHLWMILSKMT